ncbi:xanthine dehydrogenase family protein subunit M [Spongiactinospora sp. TRM90649]|uniref:FAD binding domain-containing protein n=1 Tax=Spongiactinospora sp. TRM90649 TaxID=3031114 RepID=UPI0023F8A194|nr:xanthine dehydrogenase family protein subunit M [Spongiactinospora sp. TRM90649]MDF5751348.1 xanthine dehydrogenase family protein subunit M [Spongiactinospora sp. TRM90649]
MIPAPFDYVRPATLDEACGALREAGEDAKVLAGGQSLLPLLRLRLAYPTVLVDVGRLAELRGIRDEDDHVFIGAAATHDEVMRSSVVNAGIPLVALATRTVADPAVRHRGTFGGSLAHADPAGDLPAVALALDCVFVVRSADGEREIPASEFFADYLEPAIEPDEILVGIRVPKLGPDWGYHYEKFHRTAQAWAIVGVAAAVRRSDGSVREARIGLTNMGTTPLRASATEAALRGVPSGDGGDGAGGAVAEACAVAAEGTSPPADLHGGPDYRRHLARVLTRRAVLAAARA